MRGDRGRLKSGSQDRFSQVQPSKLSGHPILDPKQREEEIEGCANRGETGHSLGLGL